MSVHDIVRPSVRPHVRVTRPNLRRHLQQRIRRVRCGRPTHVPGTSPDGLDGPDAQLKAFNASFVEWYGDAKRCVQRPTDS
jgi:hypothetical protein